MPLMHARAEEAERARVEQRAEDEERLDKSPLYDWFPNAQWVVADHNYWVKGTVYEADGVKLLVALLRGIERAAQRDVVRAGPRSESGE